MSRKPIMNTDNEIIDFSYRNILMVFLPISGAIVSLSYALMFEFYFEYHLASKLIFFFFCCYLLCLIIFKFHFINFGKHFLTLIFLSQIAVHAFYLFPKESFFHIYFLVGVPLIYMLFTRKEQKSRISYSLIFILLLFIIEFGFINPVLTLNQLTPEMMILIKNANVVTSVIVLSFTIILFTLMMEKAEEKAYTNSVTDHLTGLYNRRYFFNIANKKIRSSHKNKKSLTIAFLDLDHFKTINDEYGHYIGDQVLILVANILKNNIHQSDVVARIGGEEFVIIYDDTTSQHGMAKAEVIRQAVLSAEIPNTTQKITISIGVTDLSPNDKTINQLLKRADNALYFAKESGRNRVEFRTSDSTDQENVIPLEQKID